MSKKIYLIEKACIDSTDNKDSILYEPIAYSECAHSAKVFCECESLTSLILGFRCTPVESIHNEELICDHCNKDLEDKGYIETNYNEGPGIEHRALPGVQEIMYFCGLKCLYEYVKKKMPSENRCNLL